MYESKHQRPLPRPSFVRRLGLHLALALAALALSLGIGMMGYRALEDLPWLDACLNAATLLGDMGPVDLSKTDGGKLFAGGYALYAGLVFIATAALVLTPVLHRLLHRFPLGRERMSVPGVKVRRSANVLSARMAMAAGVSALGLVSATPGGPGPIDRAFLAGLCRGPA